MNTIPLDPADLDRLPPHDVADCSACSGTGYRVGYYDPTTGHYDADDCRACDGSGWEPGWEPVAS